MTGVDKFNEARDKLKKEHEEKEAAREKKLAEIKNQLDKIRENPDMMQMYRENALVGSQNLSAGSLPTLKIYATGRTRGSLLADGTKPNDGWFYYKPTQEQFQTVECHILSISDGFYAPPMEEGEGKKEVFTQLIVGIIVDEFRCLPFITFLTGLKLAPMWEFAEEVSRYTKSKQFPIPMFAMRARLSSESVETNFGDRWKILFSIMRNDDKTPVVITDPDFFREVRDRVDRMEAMMESYIDKNAIRRYVRQQETPLKPLGEDQVPKSAAPVAEAVQEPDPQGPKPGEAESIAPDDIPF